MTLKYCDLTNNKTSTFHGIGFNSSADGSPSR